MVERTRKRRRKRQKCWCRVKSRSSQAALPLHFLSRATHTINGNIVFQAGTRGECGTAGAIVASGWCASSSATVFWKADILPGHVQRLRGDEWSTSVSRQIRLECCQGGKGQDKDDFDIRRSQRWRHRRRGRNCMYLCSCIWQRVLEC